MVDWLTEKRSSLMTKDIVVNVNWSPLPLMDHEDRSDSKTVGSSQEDFFNDLRVVSEIAEENTEILHHIIFNTDI